MSFGLRNHRSEAPPETTSRQRSIAASSAIRPAVGTSNAPGGAPQSSAAASEMPGLCATMSAEPAAAGTDRSAAIQASPEVAYRARTKRIVPSKLVVRATASAVSFARAAGEATIASGTAASFASVLPIRSASSRPRVESRRSKSV